MGFPSGGLEEELLALEQGFSLGPPGCWWAEDCCLHQLCLLCTLGGELSAFVEMPGFVLISVAARMDRCVCAHADSGGLP